MSATLGSPETDKVTGTGTATAVSDAVFRDTGPSALGRGRQWLGNNRFWLICIAVFLILSLLGVVVAGSGSRSSGTLSITNPAPAGAQAAAAILKDRGVTVIATDSLSDTTTALTTNGSGNSTVLFHDPKNLLTPEQVAELASAVRHANGTLVVITPGPLATQSLGAGFGSVGSPAPTPSVQAQCSNKSAAAAGTIDGGAPPPGILNPVAGALRLYKGSEVCFPLGGTGSSAAGYLALNDSGDVAILGNPGVLINENLASRGNAALTFGLLGHNPDLLWYTTSLKDVPITDQPPSLAEFTPEWVFPATSWLLLVAVLGMLWRGRRSGPLVTEPLPVIVKSSETLAGRARLYQDARAAGTAGQTLQHATLTRLAQKLRLGHSAQPSDVVHAVTEKTGRNGQQIHALLVGDVPHNDKDLMTMAVELAALEEEVTPR